MAQKNKSKGNKAAYRRLEDAVDNVATNRGTSTKDGGVTKLLAKLLAILANLAVARGARLTWLAALCYRHGRNTGIVRVLLRRWSLGLSGIAVCRLLWIRHRGGSGSGSLLLLLDEDVVLGEDALQAGAVVAAHPPVLVHVFVHVDLVVLLQAQVATITGLVAVQGPGMGQYGPASRRTRGEVGCGSVLVRGRRRRDTVDIEILEGLDGRRRGRRRLSGSLGGRAGRAAWSSSAKGRFGGKSGVDRVEGSFIDDAFLEKTL